MRYKKGQKAEQIILTSDFKFLSRRIDYRAIGRRTLARRNIPLIDCSKVKSANTEGIASLSFRDSSQ